MFNTMIMNIGDLSVPKKEHQLKLPHISVQSKLSLSSAQLLQQNCDTTCKLCKMHHVHNVQQPGMQVNCQCSSNGSARLDRFKGQGNPDTKNCFCD